MATTQSSPPLPTTDGASTGAVYPGTEMPWSRGWEDVARALEVDVAQGLTPTEAVNRRDRFGPNQLRRHKRRSLRRILFDQFRSLIVWLLVAAAAVAFLFDETLEGWAILVVILLNTGLGFFSELRAVRSMEALFKLGSVSTRVRRGGVEQAIDAQDLVPGDVVLIEGGDVVTADLRLVESSKLQADESALTGESVPVAKHVAPAPAEALLAERPSMLYKGTAVTRGSGEGVVTATGTATELGRISELVAEADEEATPLEERLDRLGHRLIGVTIVVAVFVAVSGTLAGKDLFLMIETGIALAVAAIPEGLPIVATIALARGMRRMARRNALINRLSSVETLGATSTIFTDKTGTLTENRMTVVRLALPGGDVEVTGEGLELEGVFRQDEQDVDPGGRDDLRALLEVGVLCNNASIPKGTDYTGDPMEVALLVAGAKAGLRREDLAQSRPEIREEAFDPEIKMMATYHRRDDGVQVAVKGGPGAVLEACTHGLEDGEPAPLDDAARDRWRSRNERMAAGGLRVLALATKAVPDAEAEPYENLTLLGLVGLMDPPREDVREAVAACRAAGIDVVMVTGDQAVTARGIARAVGIVDGEEAEVVRGNDVTEAVAAGAGERDRLLRTRIFARVSPSQKLDLIRLYQEDGQIVAMTGDGVNDAPALKKADIGVAMGRRGTQVAREAADMVLEDDAFATIVAAVEQGRVIFDNIRRFVFYLLSCNVSEVMAVGLASLLGMMLPILPLQILFLNLVTDVFPALALGVGEGGKGVMQRPPRDPQQPILGRKQWVGISVYGGLITVAVLGALMVARQGLGMTTGQAVTVSFLTLAFSQLWHVFNMRSPRSGVFRNEITRNPYVWGALALCVGLLLLAVYVPVLARILRVEDPGPAGWALVLAFSAAPLVAGQAYLEISGRRRERRGASP